MRRDFTVNDPISNGWKTSTTSQVSQDSHTLTCPADIKVAEATFCKGTMTEHKKYELIDKIIKYWIIKRWVVYCRCG